MTKINLLSTVVVPNFQTQTVYVRSLTRDEFLAYLKDASANYCGHPLTWSLLKEHAPQLPDPVRGQFWDGEGIAIAVRPKGGVRGATEVEVTLDDLEFCTFAIAGHV